MKITIESTSQIIKVSGLPARVWEGQTESGIPIFCVIASVGVHRDQDSTQFKAELKECKEPVITKDLAGTRMDFLD